MSNLGRKIGAYIATMPNLRRKIIASIVLGVGTAWQFRYLPLLSAHDRNVTLLVLAIFVAVVATVLFFSATIKAEDNGIRVEQFGVKHLSFTDVTKCVTVPFFPQTFLLVRTTRPFPLSILFCPLTIAIDSGGQVERVKLADFLRSRNPRLGTKNLSGQQNLS